MVEVEEHEVRLRPRREPPEVVAPERLRAADGRGAEDLPGIDGADVARHHPGEDDREAHLLDEVVGGDVGAHPHVHPARPVAAEVGHRVPVAGEGGGAVGDGGPGVGEAVEVAGRAPADVRVLVDEDGVPEDRVGAEEADVGGVLERGLPVAAHDLVELELRLREVGGEGAAGLARVGGRVAEGRLGAGLDLARVDDAAKAPARVLLGEVHDPDGCLELAPPARLVPVEAELVPVLELPVRVGEERADVDPKAAAPGAVEPPFNRAREVRHGGDAGQEQLRVGHLHRGLAAGLVEGEGAGALVEPGVVHLGDPVVLAYPLARGLGVGVGVDVDEPRHDEPPRAVDGAAGGAFVAPADVDDAVGGERDVSVLEIAMSFAVPRRDPGRVADHGGVVRTGHRSSSRVRCQGAGQARF